VHGNDLSLKALKITELKECHKLSGDCSGGNPGAHANPIFHIDRLNG